MSDLMTIFRRELSAYFNSAIAYIFLIVFAMVTSSIYMLSFFLVGRAEMRSFFGLLPMMLIVFIPAITMRLWAEDRRTGTYELLLTFPMKTLSVVLGKFMASFTFYLVGLATTLPIPIMLAMLGDPDWGPIIGGYFGSILCGAFFISIGLFISGLCKDQIIAFILGMVACFAFYFLGLPVVAAQVDGWTGSLELGTRALSYVSMTKHFESVERGLLDLRDVIYFLIMAALFLGLNALHLESRMRPHATRRLTANMAVFISLVIFVNIVLSGFTAGRFDLTEEKIFTVAEETKDVLSDLQVEVRVNYYVSPAEKMPSLMKTFEQEVVDKLRELEIASNGNLKFKVNHVEALDALNVQQRQMEKKRAEQRGEEYEEKKLTEREKLAEELLRKGIMPFQVRSIEADEAKSVAIYSAISVAYKEKDEEILPRLVPQNFGNLEYEIISRVFRLIREKKPRVVVFAPKDVIERGQRKLMELRGEKPPPPQDNFTALEKILLSQDYDVERRDFDELAPIPEDVNTVVIVCPRYFKERQRWEVNRALRSGKSVILAVQSYLQRYITGRQIRVVSEPYDHGINELLEEYGLKVSQDFLMDLQMEVMSINTGQQMGPYPLSAPVELPTQILLTDRCTNPDVSISSRLSSVLYMWGTALDLDRSELESHGLETTVVLKSGERSWTRPFKAGEMKPEDITVPSTFERGRPLAVLVEGQFPDIYEGQERPQWPMPETPDNVILPNPPPEPPVTELPPKPGRLLLVGSGFVWHDSFIRSRGNSTFFVNSVDAMALSEDLIHVRTKTKLDRSIRKVSAGERLGYRFFATGLIPLGLAVAGVTRLWLRRRAKEKYLREVVQR